MNFKNIATITGLATGAAVALAAMPAQAVTFTIEGHECFNCVHLEDAGYTISGDAEVVNPSVSNSDHKTPGTDFLAGIDEDVTGVASFNSASSDPSPGTTLEVLNLDGVFEFFWGSVDEYNVIEFFDGVGGSTIFDGSDIAAAVGLDPLVTTGAGNYNFDALVKFTGDFTSAKLTSTNIAFEVAAAVPEPASILGLAVVGLIGGASIKRRGQEA